ncbi:NAD(P)-binding protein [Saitoella complicata NRRL Y-17804]|uniref:6-phosphogluconate dehydrogenase NADP-binding domain-containing protein n=1 Tax=Saitoella complicata (strain BCRC 22490 / CBS 7301 / JCM 7358 / NBRC 10748 / NRRL Y-17804) TaxID=698492 RepID=A0A0E9NLN2_SAICN|nr:NAD(P)-binding protein [Saitoella complicata NRRL Y-17804]ODQ55500.1 NAD(P)-binding protein [Saitoella complicata NRRL Y-17804]GAO50754.1 hypothetical protein G7K_4875-t1 [Saitoella complicata NRRL Y-17804]
MSSKIGFIGLGAMGVCMAGNLISHHGSLNIYNRTSSKADAFKASNQNAKVHNSVSSLVAASDIIFNSTANDEAALSIFREITSNGSGEGRVVVDMSTLYPDTTADLERMVKAWGGKFCCVPVMGAPHAAKTAGLIAIISGADAETREQLDKVIVPAIAKASVDVGDAVRTGATLKLLGNFLVVGIIELLAEAMTLATKTGVPRSTFYEMIKLFLPAPSFIGYSRTTSEMSFTPTTGLNIPLGQKDVGHISRLADEHGVEAPSLRAAKRHLDIAQEEAGERAGEVDWSSLVVGARKLAGLGVWGDEEKK